MPNATPFTGKFKLLLGNVNKRIEGAPIPSPLADRSSDRMVPMLRSPKGRGQRPSYSDFRFLVFEMPRSVHHRENKG